MEGLVITWYYPRRGSVCELVQFYNVPKESQESQPATTV